MGNNYLLSVDCTDFRIAKGYSKPSWTYKFKKSGVRYEVGLCILTGDICWWNGPKEPGIWNDGMIFEDALKLNLEFGEQCETDAGHRGSMLEFVKCHGVVWGESAKREMQQKVRSRQ